MFESNNDPTTAADVFGVFQIVAAAPPTLLDFSDNPIIIPAFPSDSRSLIIRPSADNLAISANVIWSNPPDPV